MQIMADAVNGIWQHNYGFSSPSFHEPRVNVLQVQNGILNGMPQLKRIDGVVIIKGDGTAKKV